ncbi:DUF6188 family protein [Streptomyces sp. IBSBF 2806]|uniref:DUF6188 family protein n=1 Tax=Streptomyces sp. IBSBF 2806 TaxID=2903529 RepID=UPI003FA6EA7B
MSRRVRGPVGSEPSQDERCQDQRGLPARSPRLGRGSRFRNTRQRLARFGRRPPVVLLNPESQDVAAALALFGAKVLSAVAFKSGTLRIIFDTGLHLNCVSGASFEGWQATGPAGRRLVSLLGGDLAVWTREGARWFLARDAMGQV